MLSILGKTVYLIKKALKWSLVEFLCERVVINKEMLAVSSALFIGCGNFFSWGDSEFLLCKMPSPVNLAIVNLLNCSKDKNTCFMLLYI